VIQPASGVDSSATTLPMSAGVPMRPIGVQPLPCHLRATSTAASPKLWSTLSSVSLGLTELTVMPRGASVTAK
jgi:hypothetical protein